jgi:hypothetical protein
VTVDQQVPCPVCGEPGVQLDELGSGENSKVFRYSFCCDFNQREKCFAVKICSDENPEEVQIWRSLTGSPYFLPLIFNTRVCCYSPVCIPLLSLSESMLKISVKLEIVRQVVSGLMDLERRGYFYEDVGAKHVLLKSNRLFEDGKSIHVQLCDYGGIKSLPGDCTDFVKCLIWEFIHIFDSTDDDDIQLSQLYALIIKTSPNLSEIANLLVNSR